MSELKIANYDEDFELVMQMVKRFAKASPYADIRIDEDKLYRIVTQILDGDKAQGIIIIGFIDGTPAGLIAGCTTEMILNSDKLAHELMYWVEPEFRGGRLAIELMDAFEFWAKKVGCVKVQMSLVETDLADKVSKLYIRRGYEPRERAFLKAI